MEIGFLFSTQNRVESFSKYIGASRKKPSDIKIKHLPTNKYKSVQEIGDGCDYSGIFKNIGDNLPPVLKRVNMLCENQFVLELDCQEIPIDTIVFVTNFSVKRSLIPFNLHQYKTTEAVIADVATVEVPHPNGEIIVFSAIRDAKTGAFGADARSKPCGS